ncbi:HAD-IA family hydrolase [Varunaivibrio sulfuroxidans]|uniref:HAD superfamily hydrolase (TIGR01509 family) n=1 Tax=Varunaivibrio sulfuroxidans TaxID=1773489 RepID=A0A4R3JGV6_9PROT|nr:HAD-IA family hydrolase [Varunaivibrio sulfuroxidans]TCS65172.1 HAD superfamily hydrolase (TIGR01509 family) [Varunaivibrio sulfuroxidans]WES29546.1 HAD-IA family hydrolase [Varunaivibrio sulfuroxidans]
MKMQALIFDVDGTLADTEDAHRHAFNAAFAEAGLDWSWDQALYKELLAVTGGKQRIRAYMEQLFLPPADDPGGAQRIAELHARKTAFFVEALKGGAVPLRPGVEALLRESRDAGVRLAIATTTTPVNVRALVAANLGEEAINWFEVIGDGGVVPRLKPLPDVYLWVLEKMRLDAGDCLAIEDSANGVAAARAARVPVVVTRNMYTQDHDFSGAIGVLDDLQGVGLNALGALYAAACGVQKKPGDE